MIALLRKRFAHRNAAFTELGEYFFVRDNLVWELESPLLKANTSLAAPRYYLTTLQFNRDTIYASLKAARFSATS